MLVNVELTSAIFCVLFAYRLFLLAGEERRRRGLDAGCFSRAGGGAGDGLAMGGAACLGRRGRARAARGVGERRPFEGRLLGVGDRFVSCVANVWPVPLRARLREESAS
jgi:hypothetical protein